MMSGFDYPIEELVCRIPEGSVHRSLVEFREFLNKVEADIPAEHRHTATIGMDAEWFGGESVYSLVVTYERPPTEQEVARRRAEQREYLEREKDRLRRIQSNIKNMERET